MLITLTTQQKLADQKVRITMEEWTLAFDCTPSRQIILRNARMKMLQTVSTGKIRLACFGLQSQCQSVSGCVIGFFSIYQNNCFFLSFILDFCLWSAHLQFYHDLNVRYNFHTHKWVMIRMYKYFHCVFWEMGNSSRDDFKSEQSISCHYNKIHEINIIKT